MGDSIREPIQKRSIEKKEKIIEYGFKLICEKGYHNTNTAEIAKAAGVSTGIIYSYFEDKHDILLAGIQKRTDKLFYPLLEDLTKDFKSKKPVDEILHSILQTFVSNHEISAVSYQEIMALTYSDSEIAKYYYEREIEMTNKLFELLIGFNFPTDGLKEKIHFIIGMIENYCHEIIYHKHNELDYDEYEKILISNFRFILNK